MVSWRPSHIDLSAADYHVFLGDLYDFLIKSSEVK